MKIKHKVLFLFIIMTLLHSACSESNPQPKPHGYFRIDFPEKKYQEFNNEKLSFRYPEYGVIIIDPLQNNQKDWFDISFPAYNACIHLSYHEIANNFDTLTEDARSFAMKHIPKASGIRQTFVENDSAHVYGLVYDISGVGTASPCQFFLSDTTNSFLRGSLYFNVVPNNDSLAPVIKFIREDIDTLFYSLRWNK